MGFTVEGNKDELVCSLAALILADAKVFSLCFLHTTRWPRVCTSIESCGQNEREEEEEREERRREDEKRNTSCSRPKSLSHH
jgi:hypothetical protein